LGCPVIYYDPFRTHPLGEPWVHVKKLEDLVKQADIITLHAPAQKDNNSILNGSLLGQCRRNVIIINTARGSLIDERGLINALDNGTVRAAGLDVLPKEPYEGPLLGYPQVIITPHVASNTVESREQMETEALVNLISALEEPV
jgi:D-3-phosphoglycerate dehydrogenase